jgi:hypothetical protein
MSSGISFAPRQVKNRILEAECAVKQWTKPKLSDPNNERVLLEFRERLRRRLERGSTQEIGGNVAMTSKGYHKQYHKVDDEGSRAPRDDLG